MAQPGTAASTTTNALTLIRKWHAVQFSWTDDLPVEFLPTAQTFFPEDLRRQHMLRIKHGANFTIEVTFIDLATTADADVQFSHTADAFRMGDQDRTSIHAVNLESVPIDIRTNTSLGTKLFEGVPPGGSVYDVLVTPPDEDTPTQAVFIATKRLNGRTYTTTKIVRL